jgi:hypothetical protein
MKELDLIADLSSALRGMLDAFSLDNKYGTAHDAMSRRLAAKRYAREMLNLADEHLHFAAITAPPKEQPVMTPEPRGCGASPAHE